MPSHGPTKLPQVLAPTPRGSAAPAGSKVAASLFRAQWHATSKQPHRAEISRGDPVSEEQPSNAYSPPFPSKAEALCLATDIDASIELPPGYDGASAWAASSASMADGVPSDEGNAEDWEVQSPEEILRDVKRALLDRRVWCREEDMEESFLDKRRRSERGPREDGGIHIILPNNRVRAVEDQLSRRIHSELLGEEDGGGAEPVAALWPPRRPRRPEEGRRRQQENCRHKLPRRLRNPWYLPPKTWFNPESLQDPSCERGGGFPYDSRIMRRGESDVVAAEEQERDSGGGDGSVRALTKREKDTLQIVEAYRQYIKGHRLPHFLQ